VSDKSFIPKRSRKGEDDTAGALGEGEERERWERGDSERE